MIDESLSLSQLSMGEEIWSFLPTSVLSESVSSRHFPSLLCASGTVTTFEKFLIFLAACKSSRQFLVKAAEDSFRHTFAMMVVRQLPPKHDFSTFVRLDLGKRVDAATIPPSGRMASKRCNVSTPSSEQGSPLWKLSMFLPARSTIVMCEIVISLVVDDSCELCSIVNLKTA